MHVERVLLQRVERNHRQRFLVRGREHDRRRDAGLVGLTPGCRADTPAIAGFQARKVVLRCRRDEIVALLARELEKRARDLRADDVESEILGAGVATAVAVEAGARRD